MQILYLVSQISTPNHARNCASNPEEYVRFVAENATPCALSTRVIERVSAVDKELSNVRECIQKEQWETLENKR